MSKHAYFLLLLLSTSSAFAVKPNKPTISLTQALDIPNEPKERNEKYALQKQTQTQCDEKNITFTKVELRESPETILTVVQIHQGRCTPHSPIIGKKATNTTTGEYKAVVESSYVPEGSYWFFGSEPVSPKVQQLVVSRLFCESK